MSLAERVRRARSHPVVQMAEEGVILMSIGMAVVKVVERVQKLQDHRAMVRANRIALRHLTPIPVDAEAVADVSSGRSLGRLLADEVDPEPTPAWHPSHPGPAPWERAPIELVTIDHVEPGESSEVVPWDDRPRTADELVAEVAEAEGDGAPA